MDDLNGFVYALSGINKPQNRVAIFGGDMRHLLSLLLLATGTGVTAHAIASQSVSSIGAEAAIELKDERPLRDILMPR